MHILPQLRKLEEAFPEELVVVGVHSAKFPAEKETDAVRQAILRYDIRHPVVNDRDFQVWQRYAARAWPSLFFVDPEGKVLGKHEGEYRFEDLDRFLRPLIEAYEIKGALQRSRFTGRLSETSWRRKTLSRSPANCWPTSKAIGSSSRTPATTASSSRRWTAKCSRSLATVNAG